MTYEDFIATAVAWGVPLVITLSVALLLGWILQTKVPWKGNMMRPLSLTALALLTVLMLLVDLPISQELRGQLLSLFGLVLTGVIALASTSSVTNAMAGLTLRGIRNFQLGDFIRIGDHFGRVTEQGLMHTEIQSEDRDLITLPNLYVVSHPVQVVRSSGTLISAAITIGYDVHHSQVSALLRRAAEESELREPFVQITELGNFAVAYKVSGFLEEVSGLVSKRSKLKAQILDTLHEAGVEIMSPSVMAQRPLAGDLTLIPGPTVPAAPQDTTGHAEKLMFDKADVAARIQQFEAQKKKLLGEIAELKNSDDEENREARTRWRERQIESLDAMLETLRSSEDVD